MRDEDVVRALWAAFDRRDFDAAGRLVAEDVVVEWPQSRERIRGRGNFVELNRHYPGEWRMHVERVARAGDEVVSWVRVPHSAGTEWAVSFFRLRDGLIARATEFWAAEYPAPAWRRAWTEPTDG